MMKASVCPEISELNQFVTGNLPSEEMECLVRHLEACDSCLAKLPTLGVKDALVDMLAKAKTQSDIPDDPLLTVLIARLAEMAKQEANRAKDNPVSPWDSVPPVSPKDASEEKTVLPSGAETKSGLSAVRTNKLSGSDTDNLPAKVTMESLNYLRPAQQTDELGRLGEYRILKVLGAGGMGMVFLAEDTVLHRKVALKVMLPTVAAGTSACDRFLREARAAASIEHEHIVPIFQVGEDNKVPFLAMPFLKGEPLNVRIEREKILPLAEALRIAREMAEGLVAAHANNLIHRDIKPGNIWLEGTKGKVRLLDFGLAREQDDTTHLTQSGALVGTPAYMAPEQARGEEIDVRADLFSLGCVLYLMLTGRRPFRGNDTISLLMSLAVETPPLPTIINHQVPNAVSDLTMRLLAKQASDRPASARAVADELTALAQVEPSPVRDQVPGTKPRKKSRAPVLFAVGLFFAAMLGGLIFFAPTIFRIVTNQGELIVEVDDPDIEVLLKQDGVVVRDKTKHRDFVLTARAGEIEFLQHDIKLTTKTFELTRGGKTRVKVTAQEIAAAKPAALPVKPGDKLVVSGAVRKAVERVLELGGWVTIKPVREQREIKTLKELPTEEFQVVRVNLYGKHLEADGLTFLQPLIDLKILDLWGPSVRDHDLAHLKSLTKLKVLDLSACNLTEAGLVHLQPLSDLESLDLRRVPFQGSGLAQLKPLTNLIDLVLERTNVYDVDLVHLQGLPKLDRLSLSVTKITDAGLVHLGQMPQLTLLYLNGNNIGDIQLADLKPLRNLVLLGLASTGIGDAGLVHLQGMAKLRTLHLDRTKISSAGLKHLEGMNDLTTLYLNNNNIDDSGLDHLKKLTGLRLVALTNTKVTAAGVAALQKALPKCHIESDFKVVPPKARPLDAKMIPEQDRRPWLPKETVAIIGDLNGRAPFSVSNLVVSPDGKWLAAVSSNLQLYDATTMRLHWEPKFPASNYEAALLDGGKTLVAVGGIWDLTRPQPTLITKFEQNNFVFLAAQGPWLAACSRDGAIRLWQWKNGKLKDLATVDHRAQATKVFFYADGNTLGSYGSGIRCLWEVSDAGLKEKTDVKYPFGGLSPDGTKMVTYDIPKSGGNPVGIILWDITGPKPRQLHNIKGSIAWGTCFAPDSKSLAVPTGSAVQIWSIEGESVEPRCECELGGRGTAAVFAPDGKSLFVARSGDAGANGISVYDVDRDRLTRRFGPGSRDFACEAALFSPRRFLAGDNGMPFLVGAHRDFACEAALFSPRRFLAGDNGMPFLVGAHRRSPEGTAQSTCWQNLWLFQPGGVRLGLCSLRVDGQTESNPRRHAFLNLLAGDHR